MGLNNHKFKLFFLLFGLFVTIQNMKAYELKLKTSVFKGQRHEFSLSKFIDARLNKQKPVGFTRIGLSNTVEELLLPKNFAAYCDTLFANKKIRYEGRVNLIPVITQITIQETNDGGKEFSNVSLALDFYLVEKDSCSLYYRSFTKVNNATGIDVTKKHGTYLSQAFSMIFYNLNAFITRGVPQFKPSKIAMSQLKDTLEISNYSFHDPPMKEGIYFSCRDLINNEPSATFLDLISNVDTNKNEILFSESTDFFRRNYFFAFVKGNTLYIHLRDLTYHKSSIDIRNRLGCFKNLQRSSTSIGAGAVTISLGLMFGLVGAIIAETIRISSMKTEILEKLYLDLETGLIDINP